MYFPKGFFPNGQLPKGILQSEIFLNGQFPNQQLPKAVLAVALGPHACSSRGPRPPSSSQPQRLAPIAACAAAPKSANLTFGKLPLGNLDIWEVTNCQLGSCIWEIAFGKVPNTFESLQIDGTLKLRVHFYCLRSNFNLCTKLFKNLYIYRKLLYFLKLPVLQSAIYTIYYLYIPI